MRCSNDVGGVQHRNHWWDGFLSGVGTVAVLLLAYVATRVSGFNQMYADFGGVLPLASKVALHPMTAPGLTVLIGGSIIVLNLGYRESKGWRTLALGLLAAFAYGALALVYAGIYAPIGQLSSSIAPP